MRATAVSSSRSRPMYPTLTRGRSSSTGASRPRPARSTGIATTSVSTAIASDSASGVRTLPRRPGRSAVASYSRNVITLRASTRNSSGGVVLSRKPRRVSATSGCLLTLSGTGVAFDQPPHSVDGHLQHAVHVRGVEVMDLAGAELVDAEVDRACSQLPQPRNDEERRSLHVVAEDAGLRPHRELIAEMRARHLVRKKVRVERIHGSDEPNVVARA